MKAFLAVISVLVSGSAAQYLIAPYSAAPYTSLGYNALATPYSPLATPYSPLATPYSPLATPYNPLATPYTTIPFTTYSAPRITPVIPSVVSTQYHSQDELGQFAFGHSSPGQSREETKTFDGTVRGSYSYVDPNGKVNQVVYKAGHDGFQILGANNLPVAPEAKLEPVQETPEVVAARTEFARKFEEAKEAALKAPEEIKNRRRRDVTEAMKEEKKIDLPTLTIPETRYFDPYNFYNPLLIKSIDSPIVSPFVFGKTTVKTSELTPIEDSKVPASTKLAEIKDVEKDIVSPISYTTPLAYSALPYSGYPYTYSSFPYSALSYSSYPYGYSPFLLKR